MIMYVITKKIQGPVAVILIAVIPVLLWWFFSPLAINLSSASLIIDALARITALSAISLLSFNIILSARLSMFERLFLGLDRSYHAHRLIGGLVLVLLLLHAMLVTMKYSNISLISGYEFLKPNFDIALMLGNISLFVMIVLIITSVYFNIKYRWFVVIQRILGAIIFFGGYHAVFVSGSDVTSNIILALYLGSLGILAAGLYIYRSIFHKSIKSKYSYIVDSVRHTGNVTQIWLKPKERVIPFYAGQFGFFQFISKAVDKESHPFSFSSGSNDGRVRIAVKILGDYTKDLANVNTVDKVIIEGPYGQFSFSKIKSKRQVWVAGGIGVTPFLSMAHSLPLGYEVTLYYCVSTLSQAVFKEELEQIAQQNKGFHVVNICRNINGPINGKVLAKLQADDYLICAPPLMMHGLEQQLIKEGISKNNIHYEEFDLK